MGRGARRSQATFTWKQSARMAQLMFAICVVVMTFINARAKQADHRSRPAAAAAAPPPPPPPASPPFALPTSTSPPLSRIGLGLDGEISETISCGRASPRFDTLADDSRSLLVEATPNPRTPRDPRATATTAAIARHRNGLQPLRLILAEPCSHAAAGGRLPFMPLFCPEGICCRGFHRILLRPST